MTTVSAGSIKDVSCSVYAGHLFLVNRFCKGATNDRLRWSETVVCWKSVARTQDVRHLVENGCQVTGVELDRELARQATEVCERVLIGNIEAPDTLPADDLVRTLFSWPMSWKHLAWPDRVLPSTEKGISLRVARW